MSSTPIRVRFAPAPTGLMHLGNIRTALMNYLFARRYQGTFILRIEDTDTERNFDPEAHQIMKDLAWLGLSYQEGPIKSGPNEPYFQSQRESLYQEKLHELQDKNYVYRCFCTIEELENKRLRQIALKKPPRYDRTCFNRTEQDVHQLLANNTPFIWRMKVDTTKMVTVKDLGHGTITFHLKDFSDFPVTRQDGSCTFLLANCIDDIAMKISHVLRGEDHLSNTAVQSVLYEAFGAQLPVFWHMPIICNAEGKKLSKRDFGFSLNDLKNAGFLPEAIVNYLGIIGGSFEKEILSMDELVNAINFDAIHTTGHIRYDVEKLKWVNHKWIASLNQDMLYKLLMPFIAETFPEIKAINQATIHELLKLIQLNVTTLADAPAHVQFYFEDPAITVNELGALLSGEQIKQFGILIHQHLDALSNPDLFVTQLKEACQTSGISAKQFFSVMRLLLTGSSQGIGIKELVTVLGPDKCRKRLVSVIQ